MSYVLPSRTHLFTAGLSVAPPWLGFTDVTGFRDFTLQPPLREGKPGLPGSAVIQVMGYIVDVQALCGFITGHLGLGVDVQILGMIRLCVLVSGFACCNNSHDDLAYESFSPFIFSLSVLPT